MFCRSFAAWRKQLAGQQPEQDADEHDAGTHNNTTDSPAQPVNPDSRAPPSPAVNNTQDLTVSPCEDIADGAGSDTGEAPKRRSSRAQRKRKAHTAVIEEPSDDTLDVTASQPQPAKKHNPAVKAKASAATPTPSATDISKRTSNAGSIQTSLLSFFKIGPPVSTQD